MMGPPAHPMAFYVLFCSGICRGRVLVNYSQLVDPDIKGFIRCQSQYGKNDHVQWTLFQRTDWATMVSGHSDWGTVAVSEVAVVVRGRLR